MQPIGTGGALRLIQPSSCHGVFTVSEERQICKQLIIIQDKIKQVPLIIPRNVAGGVKGNEYLILHACLGWLLENEEGLISRETVKAITAKRTLRSKARRHERKTEVLPHPSISSLRNQVLQTIHWND